MYQRRPSWQWATAARPGAASRALRPGSGAPRPHPPARTGPHTGPEQQPGVAAAHSRKVVFRGTTAVGSCPPACRGRTDRQQPLVHRTRQRALPAGRAARPRMCAAANAGYWSPSVLRPATVFETLRTGVLQVPLPGGSLPSTDCPAAVGPAHGTVLSPLSRRQKHGGA